MRDAPRPTFTADPHPERWSVDAAPTTRLALLFLAFLALFSVIAARIVWIQGGARDRFLAVWDRPVESLEPIPARDGRILSADGQVLAYDAPRFDLLIHYRWLEEPANDAWLTATARERLAPSDRRKKAKLAAAREDVLRERVRLWRGLAEVTGRPAEELASSRQAIQTRVERMLRAVEARRGGATPEPASAPLPEAPARPGLPGLWDRVVKELTTPPQRDRRDPLVIQEQLDDHILVRNVPLPVVAAVESQGARFPGVKTHVATDRVYPHGALAAHVLGLRQEIRPEDLAVRQERYPGGDPLDYRQGDRIGQGGIERTYEAVLRGQRGVRRITRNRRGETLSSVIVREPRDGHDVTLTFDLAVQLRAEQLLDGALSANSDRVPESPPEEVDAVTSPTGGCVVAVDIRTGALLAAATAPRVDQQLLLHPDRDSWKQIAKDPRRPLFSRLTQAAVPPGSVFKVVSAVAGLQEGAIQPDEPFLCRGFLNEPDRDRCAVYRHTGRGHGETTLGDALCWSCNVYFFDMATRLGPGPLEDWAYRFGFGVRTGIDLPGERVGAVPNPRSGSSGGKWYPGTTRQLAVGQASLTVTPLQVARMMAAVANGGTLVPLHLRQAPGDESPSVGGQGAMELVEFASGPERAAQPIEGLIPGTLERIREALRLVVEDPRGTGRSAHLGRVAIAGKTGTAEAGGGKQDHAWFAGYAPAEEPRVAFVVFLEHGGSGGKAAGPLVRELVRTLDDAGLLRGER